MKEHVLDPTVINPEDYERETVNAPPKADETRPVEAFSPTTLAANGRLDVNLTKPRGARILVVVADLTGHGAAAVAICYPKLFLIHPDGFLAPLATYTLNSIATQTSSLVVVPLGGADDSDSNWARGESIASGTTEYNTFVAPTSAQRYQGPLFDRMRLVLDLANNAAGVVRGIWVYGD